MAKASGSKSTSYKRSFQEYQVTWRGLKPLVLHNIRLANPFDPFTKRVAELVSKCKSQPTQDNLDELIHAEWLGGLYLDNQQRPVVMANGIRACLASKSYPLVKGGKDAVKAAITVLECPLIQHDAKGVTTAKELWDYSRNNNDRHLLYLPVTVNNSVVMRSRPIFPVWQISFNMTLNTGAINPDTLFQLMEIAGDAGFYDYRPDYGQFEAIVKEV